jgi:hypothetical protein
MTYVLSVTFRDYPEQVKADIVEGDDKESIVLYAEAFKRGYDLARSQTPGNAIRNIDTEVNELL